MKQYCRYCSNCVGVDENLGWCEKRLEEVFKTSIKNACTDFNFCEIDAFYYNRSDNPNDAKYKPRKHREMQIQGQISLFNSD